MGGTISAGKNNDDLIDKLSNASFIQSREIELAMKLVDRALFFPPQHQCNSYIDMAWRYQNIHISAPCIYCVILQSLKLSKNQTFLNVGSGTGYLSCIIGIILGSNGLNHAIEIDDDLTKYSKINVKKFKNHVLNSIINMKVSTLPPIPKRNKKHINYNHSFTCLPLHLIKNFNSNIDYQDNSNKKSMHYEFKDEHKKYSKVYGSFCSPIIENADIIDLLVPLLFDGVLAFQKTLSEQNVKSNFLLSSYDRIYCGAACEPILAEMLKRLLNVNGILIIPVHDQLVAYTRQSLTHWERSTISSVCFAPLNIPKYFQDFLIANNISTPRDLDYEINLQKFISKYLKKFDDSMQKESKEILHDKNTLFAHRCKPVMPLKEIVKYRVRDILIDHLFKNPTPFDKMNFNSQIQNFPIDLERSYININLVSSSKRRSIFTDDNVNEYKRSCSTQIIKFPIFESNTNATLKTNENTDLSYKNTQSNLKDEEKNGELYLSSNTKSDISELNLMLYQNICSLSPIIPHFLQKYLKYI